MQLFSLFIIGHLIRISNFYVINTYIYKNTQSSLLWYYFGVYRENKCVLLSSLRGSRVWIMSWKMLFLISELCREAQLPSLCNLGLAYKKTKTEDHKWLAKGVRGGEKVEGKGRVSVLVGVAHYPQLPPLSSISQHIMALTMSFVSSSPGGGTFRQK